MKRPGRTFGLSIAILLSVALFSLLPLMQVCFLVSMSSRFQNVDFSGQPYQPMATGGYAIGIDDSTLAVQVIMGLVFLGIAFLAWRGRPPSIRFIMVGAIALLTIFTVAVSIIPLLQPINVQQGFDSSEGFRRSLLISRAVATVLVSLYVIWYMNRGPARAFYRGYYLTDPNQESNESQRD